MNDWNNDDLEQALKRAYLRGPTKAIIVDSETTRNEFLRESIFYGEKQGLIIAGEPIDEDKILGSGLGQYYACTYTFTPKAKERFQQ